MPALKVAAVNCVTHEDICTSHGVNGYPTLILYPGEVRFKQGFSGNPLTKDGVLKWVIKQAEEKSIPLGLVAARAEVRPAGSAAPPGRLGGGLKNSSARAALRLTTAALRAAPWLAGDDDGREQVGHPQAAAGRPMAFSGLPWPSLAFWPSTAFSGLPWPSLTSSGRLAGRLVKSCSTRRASSAFPPPTRRCQS